MNEHEEPAEAGENLPVVAPPDMTRLAEQLVNSAATQGLDLTGENGLLTSLTKQVLQSALVEMAHILAMTAAIRWAATVRTHATVRHRRRSPLTSGR